MTAVLDVVKPAHLWLPERKGSYGDEAIDLAEAAGKHLDEEQKLGVDAMLSYGPGGRWLTLESAILEARQNGKTAGVLLPVTMYDLWMLPPDRIVWTAHLFKTARDAFTDFCTCIDTSPELSRRVKKISYSHGEEWIELHHPKFKKLQGATLEFHARSSGGGRGLGGKRVVMDEALILAADAMDALMPTLSARSDPQLMYGSSAGKLKSEHLRKLRRRGRAGNDPALIWIEFCAPGGWGVTPCVQGDECPHGIDVPGCLRPPCRLGMDCPHIFGVEGCALDDEALWKLANHSLGRTRANGTGITYAYVRSERRTLTPLGFGRERMGWHEDPPPEADLEDAIDMVRWSALADPQAPAPSGPIALALDVPRDHTSTSIGVSWGDGDRVMVMVSKIPGTAHVPATLKALCKGQDIVDVSLHAGGPAGSLTAAVEEALEELGLELRTVSTQEAAQATGAFIDLVAEPVGLDKKPTGEKLLGHLDQDELNNELVGAKLRKAGDWAQLWDREDDINRASLFAVTLAANGYCKHGRVPFFGGGWR
jgi:hypothetical protein